MDFVSFAKVSASLSDGFDMDGLMIKVSYVQVFADVSWMLQASSALSIDE